MCYVWTSVRVCFDCRVGFEGATVCPKCGGPVAYMGPNFRPPKKRNKKQWLKVKQLHDAGVRFGPVCCSRREHGRHIPKYLWQVDHFLASDEILQNKMSEGEKLLKKFNRAAGKL